MISYRGCMAVEAASVSFDHVNQAMAGGIAFQLCRKIPCRFLAGKKGRCERYHKCTFVKSAIGPKTGSDNQYVALLSGTSCTEKLSRVMGRSPDKGNNILD